MVHNNLFSWFFPFEHLVHGHYLVGVLGTIAWISMIFWIIYIIKFGARKGIITVSASSFFAFIIFLSTANAMCPVGFVPPGRIYHPDNNTRGLLVFANGTEKLILEPSFTGNAREFGLVMPVPSNPDINEAPENIFPELEDLTNPVVPGVFEGGLQSLSAPSGQGVTIIQQKDVGDYTVTVLTAETANALIDWLNQNGYRYNPSDTANFNYYVEKGGFYFVAMKVNMTAARVDAQGFLNGRLRPIEFAFAAPKPMLPIRSMAGDMPSMNFTLYVLAQMAYYIPGSEILFSKQLDTTDVAKIQSASRYEPLGKWLVRNNVLFNPARINEDLELFEGGAQLIIPNISARRRINPHLLPTQSGIDEVRTSEAAYVPTPLNPSVVAFGRSLARGRRGNDVKLLQIMLRDMGSQIYPEGLVTGYFGPLTYQATIRLQNQFKYQILTPIGLSTGTGYVGQQTRLVLNQMASLTQ